MHEDPVHARDSKSRNRRTHKPGNTTLALTPVITFFQVSLTRGAVQQLDELSCIAACHAQELTLCEQQRDPCTLLRCKVWRKRRRSGEDT